MKMYCLAAISLMILPFGISAQSIRWEAASQSGIVFQISNNEAQKLLTKYSRDTIFNGLLHTPVDTFDVKKGWYHRPDKGHFIMAWAVENKLHCEYVGVFPYQVFLLKEYDALSMQVLDHHGNIREDARVKFKSRNIRFDNESKTYRLENKWFGATHKVVTIELDGFRSVFNVEKHRVPEWGTNYYNNDDGPSFYSYLITDKNKYKPGDKVRFKSYALSHGKRPLHRDLEIQLYKPGNIRRLGSVTPHRPGSYAGEFQLHDSLKLSLDRDYQIRLVEKNGQVVAQCWFKYEDYELSGYRLELQLANEKQFHPASNELSISAIDENGLFLKDAKATVIVSAQNIRETFQPLLILKDTLLITQVDLDPNGITKVDIPSNLFQKSNTSYEVLVTVLNTENQRVESRVQADHIFSKYELNARFSNDSIVYEMLDNGINVRDVKAIMIVDNQPPAEITMPYRQQINPATRGVRLQTEKVSRAISMTGMIPKVVINGGIEKDSFRIDVFNPQKLDISWYVYQGSQLLKRGFGKDVKYSGLIVDRSENYHAELLFSFGGEDRIVRRDFQFIEDQLHISLDVPDRAYPGQEVEALINVTNNEGKPVSGVDLTAWGVNAKLNYAIPDLPYFGGTSAPRPKAATYSKQGKDKKTGVLNLDLKQWAPRLRLDTMKYYQFTYPGPNTFVHEYAINDSTQFAPYVMRNGMGVKIYVIELNREPIYFSWVEQPRQYSFYVSHKLKNEVTLRLSDRMLIFDSLSFAPGKKTILSVDLDHLPPNVRMLKMEPRRARNRWERPYYTFTQTESDRYLKYLSSFTNVDGVAYLERSKSFVPLFSPRFSVRNLAIKVGPLAPGIYTFVGTRDGIHTTFRHSGGYTYSFEDNIVYKQPANKLLPERLVATFVKPMATINDSVATRTVFLQPVEDHRKWHARMLDLADRRIRMKIKLPEEKLGSGFAGLLFQDARTNRLMTPCQSRTSPADFFTIPTGLYHAVVLFNNGTYLRMDSIPLRLNTQIAIDLDNAVLHPGDSLSFSGLRLASANCYASESRVIQMRRARSSAVRGNIRGTVYGEDNEPIPGANVVIKGTTIGTVTDADGHFSLDAEDESPTLVISFIGYATIEHNVSIGSEVSFSLQPDIQQLNEVVVTAFGGSTERSRFASSISMFEGRVAGVTIAPDVSDENTQSMPDTEKQEGERRLYRELLALSNIRSQFSDVAFWEPKIFTNKDGQSRFNFKYPDDITRWHATVYAMNRRLQTGTLHKFVRSYKPIHAELNTPRFLTVGDSAFFIGKVLNYTDDQIIVGEVKWNDAKHDQQREIKFSDFHTDRLLVNAVVADSITTQYAFTRDDGYTDGERRTVPVVEQGIVRADGRLSILNNGEKTSLKASHEPITVEITADPLNILSGDVNELLNYRYACNEQLASKLLGFLNHKLLMEYEGQRFKYDRDVNKIIAKLLKNQNQEFMWSWWDVSPNTSYWMSAHILMALHEARARGYEVPLDIENIKRKAEYRMDIHGEYYISDIDLLDALALWNTPLHYARHVRKLDSLVAEAERSNKRTAHSPQTRDRFLKEKFLLQEIRQLAHLPFQRDTLIRYRRAGVTGDVHYGTDDAVNHWYNDNLTVNAIAYRIAHRDSVLGKDLLPMQMYFLAQRRLGSWNTYHSSTILSAVVPDLLAMGSRKGSEASVLLNEKNTSRRIDQFPFQMTIEPGEEVAIEKISGTPVYVMHFRKERVLKAKTGGEGFNIRTIDDKVNTAREAGTPFTISVEVTAMKDADLEHVMIEIPIPGSCSFTRKVQRESSMETHREYFKDRVVIFCEQMRAGKYIFNVELLPRFTGKYFINPSQVSLMYKPVINANTDLQVVKFK